MTELNPEALSWTGLLGRWMDFARASIALPDDTAGQAWRESVAPIITLQAVTFALADLSRLPPADHALARDRAELLVARSARELEAAWGTEPMPESIMEIAADARLAIVAARRAGSIELFWPGPGTMIMPAFDVPEPEGTLAVMNPGTIVMPGEPVAFWCDRSPVDVVGCAPRATPRPRQVYRRIDDDGRLVGDVVAPIDDDPLPGLPLLVPLFGDGQVIGAFTMDGSEWLERQRAAMDGDELPVEFVGDERDC